jgi:molecular chaperone GrpE (heat shock protein)
VDPNPALVEELEMLKVSLEAALAELAETTKQLERTREEARHYRGLWMSESRYNELLS